MTTVKLKIATAVVLTVGALGLGAGALATRVVAGLPQATVQVKPPRTLETKSQVGGNALHQGENKEPPAASQGPTGEQSQQGITVRGRVLDMDGMPLAGAKLLLLGKGDKPVNLGTSAADGQFTVEVPKERKNHYFVARVDGAGIDFIDLGGLNSTAPVQLRMVKDQTIRGRVVNTEGKPVAGVRVAADNLGVYPENSLDSLLTTWKKLQVTSGLPNGVKHIWEGPGTLFAATTNAEGRFVIHGTGAERLVSLRLSGAGIADAELWVVNRHGFDPKPYNEAVLNNSPQREAKLFGVRWLLHGPDLSVVAEAGKTIRGVVKEADTGNGRPEVEVLLTKNGDGNLLPGPLLKAKTDAQGRYEIPGAHKGKSYMLEVKEDPAAGYMACQVRAADTAGYEPVTADIRVKKGVVVTGRVIDTTTGKPVPGFAMLGVLSDNPFVKDFPEFNSSAWMHREDSTDEGAFRIVTIPGPVLLMGGPDYRRLPGGLIEWMKYKPPVPDPKYPQYFYKQTGSEYFTVGGAISPLQGTFCKVVEIKPGATVVEQNIVLEQASALPVKIQDAEGHPISSAWVTGISPKNWTRPVRIENDSCSAYHIEAGKPRLMVFYQPDKNLYGTLTLKGDEKDPAVAKLRPAGTVKGRLVAEDSKPVAGFVIEVFYPTREAQEMFEHVDRAKPRVVTDAIGAFRIEGLIPGVEFKLDRHPSGRVPRRANPLAEKLIVGPGETLALGDLRAKPAPGDDEE